MAGENDATIGYLRFDHARIPRRQLLERRQHVTREGLYILGPEPGSMQPKPSAAHGNAAEDKIDPKVAQAVKYVTMMKTRIALASTAAGALSKACVIGARYSCVRKQGFADRSAGIGHTSAEVQIIDYSVQRYRVLKWTATAYAIKSATQWMIRRRHEVESAAKAGTGDTLSLDDLPELHATGAGLKALCCVVAADGIEDLRRSCGGHGFLMSSGIAPLEQVGAV
jgi:acyl-CoA oxidase